MSTDGGFVSDLWGVAEIAAAAEVSRQAVSNWRLRYDDFPKPLKELQRKFGFEPERVATVARETLGR